jgi:predicted nucleic acid-binding protein
LTLCDTGPLIALIDKAETSHARCKAALPSLTPPLVTTWACLTEAMYMLGRFHGFKGQAALWELIENEVLIIHAHQAIESKRMRELMEKYSDLPMDFADASLVTVAEVLNLVRIFTLDSDFKIYRVNQSIPFEVVP